MPTTLPALGSEVRTVLDLLLDHYRCAQVLRRPAHHFAVPLSDVREAGVGAEALREWGEHAWIDGVPDPRGRAGGANPAENCLALTEQGVAWAAGVVGRSVAGPPGEGATPPLPGWDAGERNLYFGDVLVLHLGRQAPSLEPVLDAFQVGGWARCVEVPADLSRGAEWAEHLRQTFKYFYRRLRVPCLRLWAHAPSRMVHWATR
jgi:hypothetical protein